MWKVEIRGVKNCGKWKLGGKNCGKWKFGGKIMWKVEIRGSWYLPPCISDMSKTIRRVVTADNEYLIELCMSAYTSDPKTKAYACKSPCIYACQIVFAAPCRSFCFYADDISCNSIVWQKVWKQNAYSNNMTALLWGWHNVNISGHDPPVNKQTNIQSPSNFGHQYCSGGNV